MFVQIHMLQSMPPGNLNRDETGQPKKCLFGGVTRGRISSQCLKRRIRHSPQFEEAFGDALAERTCYLPQMVADELKDGKLGVPADELDEVMAAVAAQFKKENAGGDIENAEGEEATSPSPDAPSSDKGEAGRTGQLVFFPPPFAGRIAKLVADLRKKDRRAYDYFLSGKFDLPADENEDKEEKKNRKKKEKQLLDNTVAGFVKQASDASKSLTVDIGLFGRMTTSDLVVNVEAACQVAHAIGTHETQIESDYFTAMDDAKGRYSTSQVETGGAAFGSFEKPLNFFNASVYYKYLNVDLGALRKHLPSLSADKAAQVTGVLLAAAVNATPTGKQNSFAAHSMPEFILVEVSDKKRPISYANAFLQPVEGGPGRNYMTESAKALCGYIDSVAKAFSPAGTNRVRLAVGPADCPLKTDHAAVATLDELIASVVKLASGAKP